MLKNSKTQWEKEFTEFVNTESVDVPNRLTNKILSKIHSQMNPSPIKVFSKVSLIHFVVGFFTLLFCPQFSVSITNQVGLTHYLMPLGHEFCTFVCGAVFVGLSLFAAGLILKPEEVLALKKISFLHNMTLASLSIGFFIALGANVLLSMGLLWIAGAALAGELAIDLSWKTRRYLSRYFMGNIIV